MYLYEVIYNTVKLTQRNYGKEIMGAYLDEEFSVKIRRFGEEPGNFGV